MNPRSCSVFAYPLMTNPKTLILEDINHKPGPTTRKSCYKNRIWRGVECSGIYSVIYRVPKHNLPPLSLRRKSYYHHGTTLTYVCPVTEPTTSSCPPGPHLSG